MWEDERFERRCRVGGSEKMMLQAKKVLQGGRG